MQISSIDHIRRKGNRKYQIRRYIPKEIEELEAVRWTEERKSKTRMSKRKIQKALSKEPETRRLRKNREGNDGTNLPYEHHDSNTQ